MRRLTILDLRFWARAVLVLGFAFGYAVPTARAHGGGVPQLINAGAGPYWISVWTQPEPLRVGESHFTVAVAEQLNSETTDGELGPPVLAATVELQFELLTGDVQTLVVPATPRKCG